MNVNKASNIGIAANIFLFVIKAVIGILSNSIAVISEAVNSLTDIFSSAAIKYSIYVSSKKPDREHQFGHNAAQPIAAFIVAVFAFVVGFKIIEESVGRIINPQIIKKQTLVYVILFITIFTKIILSRFQFKVSRKYSSTAIKAASVDSLNDVLSSSIAILGVFFSSLGLPFLDGIAGILVAMFILKTGYELAKENIDYLMGKAADEQLILEIAEKALKIKGVKGLNDLRSHYVGDKFHIEIHIEVDKNCPTEISHDIGKDVQYEIESLAQIQKVFVHIDPV
jgi:cation diffusion facilitator family transporter